MQGVRPGGLKEYAKFTETSLALHLWLQNEFVDPVKWPKNVHLCSTGGSGV